MIARLKSLFRAQQAWRSLPDDAKAEARRDAAGLPESDPGSDGVEAAALQWIFDAQDHSRSADGGFARHYSLVSGWGRSYPETSGYLIPTLLAAAERKQLPEARQRAYRALEWLVGIQLPDGGFFGGVVGASPQVPVTFNTGQILFGLVAGYQCFGDRFAEPMHRAARWLIDTIDADGCWRRYPTPFAIGGEKTYDTHTAWALIEAARATGVQAYADAAHSNTMWALGLQNSAGWFDKCCLSDPTAPLTHTLGYALRGVVEVQRHTGDETLSAAATAAADSLCAAVSADGFLAGRLRSDWQPAVTWACLTGSAQIAHSLLLLSSGNGRDTYRRTASEMLRYVRRTVQSRGHVGVRGGVKGSFPADGDYGRFEFLAWAAKFLLDANAAEQRLIQDAGTTRQATIR
jgi:hypothetical protein